jgi:hypothetical protein
LTQAEPLAPLAPAPQASGSPDDSLVFSLRAGDLGEIRFQLDRSDGGVRVVIGADGRNAMTAAGAEQGALESALKAAGLRVQSVSVVPLSKFGTTLARGGSAPDGRHVRHAHAGTRAERTRRVKLIG